MTPFGATPVASITINALEPAEQRLWQAVAAISRQLGDDERWCLVGGLMVALQAAQRPRVTTDIDVLANARTRPSGTTWAAQRLEAMGATLTDVDGLDGQRGFRFELESTTLRCQRASRSHASEPPAPRTSSSSLDKRPGETAAPSLCDVH
jgi:hypothetical protein